jgi:WD40 repeat protein
LREVASLTCPEERVLGVAASPDGQWLAACGTSDRPSNSKVPATGWLRIWKVQPAGFDEKATTTWEDGEVAAVAFSGNGRRLAASGKGLGSGGWLRIWDVEHEAWKQRFSFVPKASSRYFTPGVYGLALSPDGRRVAAEVTRGLGSAQIQMWNLDEEEANQARWNNWAIGLLLGGVVLVALMVVLAFRARENRSQGANRGRCFVSWEEARDREFTLRFLGGVAGLAVVGLLAGAGMWWWGPPSPSPRETPELGGPLDRISALTFSPDGKYLASGDRAGWIRLWHSGNGLEAAGQVQDAGRVSTLAFSADGRTLFAGREGPTSQQPPNPPSHGIRAYPLTAGRFLEGGYLLGPAAGAHSLALSLDGKRLVAACPGVRKDLFGGIPSFCGSRLRVWDISGQQPQERTPDREGLFVDHVHVYPSSSVLLIQDSCWTRLASWDVPAGRLSLRTNFAEGASRFVYCAPLDSPDGKTVVILDGHQGRERTKGDKVIPSRDPRKQEEPRTDTPVFPVDVLICGLTGRVPQVVKAESVVLENVSWPWEGEPVMAPDGRAAAWSLDGKHVHVWNPDGKGQPGKDLNAWVTTLLQNQPLAAAACTSYFLIPPSYSVLDVGGELSGIRLAPGGRWAAVSIGKKEIQLWNVSEEPPKLVHRLALSGEKLSWLGFLGNGPSLALAVEDEKKKIRLWNLPGQEPRPFVSSQTLDELTPEQRRRLSDGVAEHPLGSRLPDSWRDAFLDWTRRLYAEVLESRVIVTSKDRAGIPHKLLEWSPPIEVVQTQFSGDGRHLVVRYANGTVEIVRLP